MFRKSDLYLAALLWKMICNLGDPMSLRHPVPCTNWRPTSRNHITHVQWARKVSKNKNQIEYVRKETCTIIYRMGTGWRRPIGCLKLQVIFRKRATNYRALLWKMTCKDKAFYGSSPPCICYRAPSWGPRLEITSHTCNGHGEKVMKNEEIN